MTAMFKIPTGEDLKKLRKELETKNSLLMKQKDMLEQESERRAEQNRGEQDEAHFGPPGNQPNSEEEEIRRRISNLTSQMLIGGHQIEDTPQFMKALEEKHKVIRDEYNGKLQEIEKEREIIE